MAAEWRHTSAVITGPNVSAVIQSAARLERGRTLNNGRGGEGRGGERRGGEGRGGEGRGGEGRGGAGQGREGRGGEGRGGDCPHFPQTNHGCRVAPH